MLSTFTSTSSTGSLEPLRPLEPRAPEQRTLRVALVDDHLLFRQGFRAILATQPDILVVSDSDDGRSLEDLSPDVVIVDVGLRQRCGVTATREIIRRCRRARVLVLTNHADEGLASRAFAAGATGYALKDQDAVAVLAALRAVAGGGRYIAPGLPADLRSDPRSGSAGGLDELSPREREIFGLVVQGRTNRGIADRLSISIKTVEAHRAGINRKLSAHSTADLVRIAARNGLLPMGPM